MPIKRIIFMFVGMAVITSSVLLVIYENSRWTDKNNVAILGFFLMVGCLTYLELMTKYWEE